jgi:hypothetical protein
MEIYLDNANGLPSFGIGGWYFVALPSDQHYIVVNGWAGLGKNRSSAEYVILP